MKSVLSHWIIVITYNFIPRLNAEELLGCCSFEHDFETEWSKLEIECQKIYMSQGWSKEAWDYEPEEEEDGDLDWGELPEYRQKFLESIGWTKDAWNNEDFTNVNPYALDWLELTAKQREALIILGWNEKDWYSYRDTGVMPETNGRSDSKPWKKLTEAEKIAATNLGYNNITWHRVESNDKFNPNVVNLPIKALAKIDFEYLSNLDVQVEIRDGRTIGDDEYLDTRKTGMREFISELKNGSSYYLKYEDGDAFQTDLHSEIGNYVTKAFVNALKENNMFKLEWENVNLGPENWTIFIGGKGTTTSVHFDFDVFNFLWVSQGRKRMVLIPNNAETRDNFECETYYEGHSCWPKIDVLHGEKIPDSIELEIGPQSGMVIPHLSWHAVENVEATIAFGFRIAEW